MNCVDGMIAPTSMMILVVQMSYSLTINAFLNDIT